MTLISPSELAAIQSLAESGMAATATVLRRVTVQTDNGQESQWATVGTDMACWIKQITGDASTLGSIAGGVGIAQLVNIRFAAGSDVLTGDRVVVGATTYDAQAANDSDTYPAYLEMACRVID